MTTPSPPLPPDPDELASAIVDGLLAPTEADAARRDPAVARRVDEIHRVRAAVRSAPALPPPAVVDHAVAAAVAAFGTVAPADKDDRPHHLRVVAGRTGTETSWPAPRPGGRRSSPAPWLAAAAVILVVLGLVVVGITGQGDDEDQASDVVESAGQGADDSGNAADAPTSAEEGGQSEPDEGAEAGATTTLGAAPDLGSVDGIDDLRAEVQANRDVGRTAAEASMDADVEAPVSPGVTDQEACPGLALTGDPDRGTQAFVARAVFQGEPVVVHLYEDDSGLWLVATNEACIDVVDEAYE